MTRTREPSAPPDDRTDAVVRAQPDPSRPAPLPAPDDLVVEARRTLTLRCGKSSITLHANGKIVLRGDYILSDADGINRIAGGQIELN